MEKKRVLVLLGILLAAARTESRSTGAPDGACDTFTPSHGSNLPQTGDGGFKLYSELIDNGGNYEANQAYNITLRHEDSTTVFRGFLIGARGASSDLKIGTFSTEDEGTQFLNCASFGSDTATVTHTNNGDKVSMMFTWTAPGISGSIRFRYAVVKSFDTFYADLELPSMVAPPMPTVSFELPSTFTYSLPVPQPTPSVMVPSCPTTDKTEESEFPLTFRQPSGCDRQSCDIYAAMGPNADNDDFLDVYIEGTADGWVAVGFSQNMVMNQTDVVGCRISSGEVVVKDAWNPGQFNQDDTFSDYGICVHSTDYSAGRISCLFSKYGMKIEDDQDFNLKEDYWIITGMRTSAAFALNRFAVHSAIPTLSSEQYNPFVDSNSDVVVPTTTPVPTEAPPVCPAAPEVNQDYNFEFGLPVGCTKDDCDYYVAMGPNAENDKFLDVYLQGTAEGWVAVGFSNDKMMPDSDVLGCKVVNGDVAVVDTWNVGYLNMLDGDQNGLCVHSSDFSDGVISCSFSRLAEPGSESNDLHLNANLWLLFGIRTGAQPNTALNLRKHSSTPVISDQMYNPFTLEVPPTMPTSNITCPPAPDQDYPIEFGIPPGCMKEECAYYIAMGPNAQNNEYLDVYLRGTAEGWIAVGFSHDQNMPNTDVLGCKVGSGGAVDVVDSWNPQYSNSLDSDQTGICVHSSAFTNGVISCSFSRLGGDGSDSDDLRLDADLWFFFGSRTTAQPTVASNLQMHSSVPVISDKEYNPFTDERKISPVVLANITCPPPPASDAEYPVETTYQNDFYFAARINDDNPNYLDIIIQASAEGWIAIGFSTTVQMAETDVFGCQMDPSGSVVNVKDGWNPLPNQTPNQLDNTQEGICLHDAAYNGGMIRCEFSRYIPPLNSGTDLDLNQSLYRIYATGSGRDLATSSLSRHDTRPAVTDDTANIVAAASGEGLQDSIYPVTQLIKTHGILMLFSWPLLATNGIFFASWLKPALPNGEWFQVHRAVMIISLFTTLAGFIMAFVANARKSVPGLIEFSSSGGNTTHFVFGIIVVLLHIINPIIAIFRCKPTAKRRWIFNLSHAGIIGFGVQILALVNVSLGLWLIEQSSNNGFIVFIIFFLFFLVVEVTMFILTCFLATKGGVPKEEVPRLVHSSVKFCLPKSKLEPCDDTKNDLEMKETNKESTVNEDSKQKCQKKKPSSDARGRWASFGIFLGVSIIVFIIVTILVILD